jgi:hypothetical protein
MSAELTLNYLPNFSTSATMTSCQKNQNRMLKVNFADMTGESEKPVQIIGAVTVMKS